MRSFLPLLLLFVLFAASDPVLGQGFAIKFDNSKSKIDGKHIYIQIVSVSAGAWDFQNDKWNTATNLPQAPYQTLDKIGAGGVMLSAFSGGARVYLSVGGPTNSTYVGNGYRAAIYNANPWPQAIVFDKLEFGGDAGSIVNQTAVDFYSLPLFFTIDDGSAAGYINSRKAIMAEMDSKLSDKTWSQLRIKDSTGKYTIGVLNPATGTQPFTPSFGQNSTILDSAIKAALPANSTLYVGTNKITGQVVQSFTTDASGNITSTDSGDTAKIPVSCLTTFGVFCNANQVDNTGYNPGKYNLYGAISAQILRSLSFKNNDPTYFKNYLNYPYTNDPFAGVLHDPANSKNGKAYAMGYDDTGAVDVSSSLPRPGGKGFTITLQDSGDLKTILNLK